MSDSDFLCPCEADCPKCLNRLNAEIEELEAAFAELDADCADKEDRIKVLEAVVEAGLRLYRQCYNMKQVSPRWANESVCEAMRGYGKALAALDKKQT